VPAYYAAVCLTFDLLSSELACSLLQPWRTFRPILVLDIFLLELGAHTGQMDGRTDERAKAVMWPTRTAA